MKTPADVAIALRYKLTHTNAVTALCSTRVWVYGEVPSVNETFPYLTYQRLSNERAKTLAGASGLAQMRVQINALSNSLSQAEAAADAVLAALDDFEGSIGATGSAVTVRGITVESDPQQWNPPPDATETGVHVIPRVYSVWYRE